VQKFQIFAYKSAQGLSLGLVRHPQHLNALGLEVGREPVLLTPPLSSSQAYQQLELWRRRLRGARGLLRWHLLRRQAFPPLPPATGQGQPVFELVDRIRAVLTGRIISEQRLLGQLRAEGFWPGQISAALDAGVFQGRIGQFPGFTFGPWGEYTCSRCGSQRAKAAPCARCGSMECLLCLECSSLGEHRSCSTLLAVPGPGVQGQAQVPALVLDYQLTKAQGQAARELVEFWERREGRALVWAACGAGKTEVAFALIQRALAEGEEVLFAIPRQDIVREIVQRLRRAFPGLEIAAHYGGQPWLAPGRLVVATTHQVLHFFQRFGLAILDEADAFPYQGSAMLRYGLERALAPRGQLVEMTATPRGPRPRRVITIPARHHGFPLPEPEIIVDKLPTPEELFSAGLPWSAVGPLQDPLWRWLVFAPTIAACEVIYKVLAQRQSRPVGLCHSRLEGRLGAVEEFRQGRLDLLVTTTVLERGVNFPGIGVMVLYADHPLFSASTLVQMAGRVGRTAQAPTGPVIFVASKLSPALREARELIGELNRQARERGLLKNAEVS